MSAASAVCANIAEGFGRGSHADFARFLIIAAGSLREVENYLTDIADRGYLSEVQLQAAFGLTDQTSAKLGGLIAYLRRTPTPTPRKRR